MNGPSLRAYSGLDSGTVKSIPVSMSVIECRGGHPGVLHCAGFCCWRQSSECQTIGVNLSRRLSISSRNFSA